MTSARLVMRRFRGYLALGATVLSLAVLVAICLWIGTLRRPTPDAGIPSDAEIESVRGSLVKSAIGFNEIPEFTLPPSTVPRVIEWLRPSTYAPSALVIPD